MLAELRRGLGKRTGDDPRLWGILFDEMPEALMGKGNQASYAENAVYNSLTLFALHQQGHKLDSQNMNDENIKIGCAVARIIERAEDEERIINKWDQIATSSNIDELAHHMRSIIQMLSIKNIGFSYPALAVDIYRFQFPELVSGVRIEWGRTFFRELNIQRMKGESDHEE
jgi:CRISPR system Cascade subunit CasB